MLHFGGKDVKKHGVRALKRLRAIAATRDVWRETRIHHALLYPHLRVPITRKLMRLSGNCCVTCGRNTHIAGDELCMDLAIYHMRDEKRKKKERKQVARSMSSHRISITPTALTIQKSPATATRPPHKATAASLPALDEDEDDDAFRDHESERVNGGRLGVQLVTKQWHEAEKAGLHYPKRPSVRLCIFASCFRFVLRVRVEMLIDNLSVSPDDSVSDLFAAVARVVDHPFVPCGATLKSSIQVEKAHRGTDQAHPRVVAVPVER